MRANGRKRPTAGGVHGIRGIHGKGEVPGCSLTAICSGKLNPSSSACSGYSVDQDRRYSFDGVESADPQIRAGALDLFRGKVAKKDDSRIHCRIPALRRSHTSRQGSPNSRRTARWVACWMRPAFMQLMKSATTKKSPPQIKNQVPFGIPFCVRARITLPLT